MRFFWDWAVKRHDHVMELLICDGDDDFIDYLFNKVELNNKLDLTLSTNDNSPTKVRNKI